MNALEEYLGSEVTPPSAIERLKAEVARHERQNAKMQKIVDTFIQEHVKDPILAESFKACGIKIVSRIQSKLIEEHEEKAGHSVWYDDVEIVTNMIIKLEKDTMDVLIKCMQTDPDSLVLVQ